MYIVLLGAPGAGKGTQAAILAKELALVHIATGDLFRQALEQGTELGLKAKAYMERGELVPDEITVRLVMQRIESPDCKKGTVFDGFPRNLKQATALDKALARQAKAIDKAIYIKVANEELIKRLSGRWICRQCQTPYHAIDSPPKVPGKCDRCGGELYQRPDDTAETVQRRLEVYFSQTAPVIEYYARAGKLIEINGEGSVAEVGQRIAQAIGIGESVAR